MPNFPTIDKLIQRFQVEPGKKFRLKHCDPAWAGDSKVPKAERKKFAEDVLAENAAELADAQERLYASDSWSVLIILQAMDAAGKDGTIKHVLRGVNPQGCQVYSFKHPSAEELDHNFLWRCMKVLPERGRIGIFNRSYYEDVLIVKVHPELVNTERIPGAKVNRQFWNGRYEDINSFEEHLSRNGTKILKFFLNVSKEEQRKRFLERVTDPKKYWKFSPSDITERGYWDDYQAAYEEALEATSTKHAPWYVVPADHKWVSRAIVARVITKTIDDLNAQYPEVDDAKMAEIEKARRILESEAESKAASNE
ncbi:Polyphosphate:AMP phosphotransferase [Pirellula staleyi DSM 6068]|uniref:Polyphosphate:AMP phosphotransferase n=1 Tax=Pirellula staleyi (strain ATCC 27377 / DSM 6068 / ICPB 4128) TaxID=530564 RepID=D2R0E1_PIRSD|nr:polyphosphate kinase 2 family protein [Pirellula staleyi]ADB14809.1 Polyphosphate:AMP phosphotransferase [Pirellula staleyi DSM 6068]